MSISISLQVERPCLQFCSSLTKLPICIVADPLPCSSRDQLRFPSGSTKSSWLELGKTLQADHSCDGTLFVAWRCPWSCSTSQERSVYLLQHDESLAVKRQSSAQGPAEQKCLPAVHLLWHPWPSARPDDSLQLSCCQESNPKECEGQ